jgi:hypothetical protein
MQRRQAFNKMLSKHIRRCWPRKRESLMRFDGRGLEGDMAKFVWLAPELSLNVCGRPFLRVVGETDQGSDLAATRGHHV